MRRTCLWISVLVSLLAGLAAGCDDGLDPHWACVDSQDYARACVAGCDVQAACGEVVDQLDASEMAVVHACTDCLAAEADTETCRDCATATTVSCRAALADLFSTSCLAP